MRLCTVHMTDLYLGEHNSKATVAATLFSNLEMALTRLTALLDSMIWKQGRRVEDGWLWKMVLHPAFVQVSRLMRRSRLGVKEVNLVCLFSLRTALKTCPKFSPQMRAGAKAMLEKCRASLDVAQIRAISKSLASRKVRKSD